MKKSTKGALAAGAAAVLLLGGAGTLAYWSDSETVPGGTINTGHLSLDAGQCGVWQLDSGEDAPVTYADGDPLVPGDVLTKSCTYTLNATGNHMRGTLAVSAPALDNDLGGNLSAGLTSSIGGQPLGTFTEADNGKTITAEITLTFSGAAGNATQDAQAVLDELVVTAEQIHS